MTKLKPKQQERLRTILKRFMEDEKLKELDFTCTATTEVEDDKQVAWTNYYIKLK